MFGGGLPVELQNKDRLEPSFTVLLSLYDVILGGTWRKEYNNVWLWKKLFKVNVILMVVVNNYSIYITVFTWL